MTRLLTLIITLCLMTTGAEARRAHHRAAVAAEPCWLFCPQPGPLGGLGHVTHVRSPQVASGGVVGHPAGCPGRAFCGCGAAVRVFGSPVRSLWLAAAWLRFPRAAPAPGMVAARRGHVMVLESHVEGSTWIVYDANSGGHATRVHARSIAGYTIVNPRA